MTNKQQYIEFCRKQPVHLQMQPWWLDIVCRTDNWEVALAFQNDGQIVGALPYFMQHKWGLSFIKMPPLTDYLGPWIQHPDMESMKAARQQAKYKAIMQDLLDQLPKSTYSFMQCVPDVEDSLPFQWVGYRVTPFYTFLLELPADRSSLFSAFRRNTQRNIKTAGSTYEVEPTTDSSLLFELLKARFNAQNIPLSFTDLLLQQIMDALLERKQGQLLLARDRDSGAVDAALLLGWSGTQAYTLLSAGRHSEAGHIAPSLLVWEGIQGLPSGIRNLDFCGSILPDINHSISGFGGTQVPFYKVSKCKNLAWEILARLFKTEYA